MNKSGTAVNKQGLSKGVFYNVQGLTYKTDSVSGITNKKGEFLYREGEKVTFSVGDLPIGSAAGAQILTPAHLVAEVNGDIKKLTNQKATNLTRFLLCFSRNGNVENGVYLTKQIVDVINKFKHFINFDQTEMAFSLDTIIKTIYTQFDVNLPTGAQARNYMRWTLKGIKKTTDVKIPTRDGAYLLGDIFRPIAAGKYPVIMSLGAFGKAWWMGVVANQEDLVMREDWEDKFFEGKPAVIPLGMQVEQPSEYFEIAQPSDFVTQGYVVINIDGRGVGNTPGVFEQFSVNESKDYYDAIEWAGTQPWSNGKIGLFGGSYYAMNQYNVAQLQPPHLKAIVPDCGDIDSYRDYIHTGGGLYNTFNFIPWAATGKKVNWIGIALNHPFADPAIYGPKGKICITPDMKKVKVPLRIGMGIEGTIHTRGSSEAFFQAGSKNKHITVISEPGAHGWLYQKEFLGEHLEFFDHWLKGKQNGATEQPPVKVQIRTGHAGSYWLNEDDWPLKRTRYVKMYLDARSSAGTTDRNRKKDYMLSPAVPGENRSQSYPADVNWEPANLWSAGLTFTTEPTPEDIVLAGYLKLVIWVSSTTHDMELHAQVRALDENLKDVPYAVGNPEMMKFFPIAHGALKVSHRKLDPKKSTIFRPFHTHLKKDYQPLQPGEAVEAEVELWPTTAVIKKGYRLRLYIQPFSGPGFMGREFDAVDTTYQPGALNTVYTGPKYPSYLQLPMIPKK